MKKGSTLKKLFLLILCLLCMQSMSFAKTSPMIDKIYPIFFWDFGINSTSLKVKTPKTYSFDIATLERNDGYTDLYSQIFIEALLSMNKDNRALIFRYFTDDSIPKKKDDYFTNVILVNYINNLKPRERTDILETGYVNPYYTYEKSEDYKIYKMLCIGSIKAYIIDGNLKVRLGYNRISTISSLVPLILVTSLYNYFVDNHVSQKDILKRIKQLDIQE